MRVETACGQSRSVRRGCRPRCRPSFLSPLKTTAVGSCELVSVRAKSMSRQVRCVSREILDKSAFEILPQLKKRVRSGGNGGKGKEGEEGSDLTYPVLTEVRRGNGLTILSNSPHFETVKSDETSSSCTRLPRSGRVFTALRSFDHEDREERRIRR